MHHRSGDDAYCGNSLTTTRSGGSAARWLDATGLSGTAFIYLACAVGAPLGGVLADHLRRKFVGGRMFARPKPLGAPDPKPGKTPSPPPKAVVRMLFAVHPELRRRKKAAKETFATHRWRADRAAWRTQHAPVLRMMGGRSGMPGTETETKGVPPGTAETSSSAFSRP